MLPYLRRRQFTDSGEFIDSGFWDPEEPCHFCDGQNLVVGSGHPIGLDGRWYGGGVIHD